MRLVLIVRGLLRAPRFSLSVLATLGSGLTVSLLMWAVLWQAVLAPLPYPDAQNLVTLGTEKDAQKDSIPSVLAHELPNHLPPGYAMTSFFWNGTTFLGGERPQVMTTLAVDANYFEVLGIRPFIGRGLLPSDADTDNIVLGESTWRTHFNADPNILGKPFREEGGNTIIVGVVAKTQAYPAPDLAYFKAIDWSAMAANQEMYLNARFLAGVVRAPARDVLADRVSAALAGANAALGKTHGAPVADWRIEATSFESAIRGVKLRAPLFALSGLSLLVLLIAATNAAHLVLTRGRQRAATFGVMDALGAPRAGLARLILSEVALLCAAALLLAFIACALIVKFSPNLADSGISIDPNLGLGVLFNPSLAAAAALFGALAMLLASAYPVLQVWRRGASHALVAQRSGGRALHWLGVPGIALSIAGLFAAALFMRTAQQLQTQPLGLDVTGTVAAQYYMNGEQGDASQRFADRAAEVLAAAQKIPGATAVSIVAGAPFAPVGNLTQNLPNGPALAPGAVLKTNVRAVMGDALGALGYQLRAGRALDATDAASAPPVALINQRFAKAYFGVENPIGQSIPIVQMGQGDTQAPGDGMARFTVVGVLNDARFERPDLAAGPEIWLPFAQFPMNQNQLSVLVKGAPNGLKAVQEAVWSVNPNQAIFRAYALSEDLYNLSAAPRFFARFAGLFGVLAMLLAALGSYAILAFGVAERKREFALRSALGAKDVQLVHAVMRENLRALVPGVLLGIATAWALGRILAAHVYGEIPYGALTLLATGIVVLISALSSYIAARPAARVALVSALKAD
jgi:putative ABC transport system permease protein